MEQVTQDLLTFSARMSKRVASDDVHVVKKARSDGAERQHHGVIMPLPELDPLLTDRLFPDAVMALSLVCRTARHVFPRRSLQAALAYAVLAGHGRFVEWMRGAWSDRMDKDEVDDTGGPVHILELRLMASRGVEFPRIDGRPPWWYSYVRRHRSLFFRPSALEVTRDLCAELARRHRPLSMTLAYLLPLGSKSLRADVLQAVLETGDVTHAAFHFDRQRWLNATRPCSPEFVMAAARGGHKILESYWDQMLRGRGPEGIEYDGLLVAFLESFWELTGDAQAYFVSSILGSNGEGPPIKRGPIDMSIIRHFSSESVLHRRMIIHILCARNEDRHDIPALVYLIAVTDDRRVWKRLPKLRASNVDIQMAFLQCEGRFTADQWARIVEWWPVGWERFPRDLLEKPQVLTRHLHSWLAVADIERLRADPLAFRIYGINDPPPHDLPLVPLFAVPPFYVAHFMHEDWACVMRYVIERRLAAAGPMEIDIHFPLGTSTRVRAHPTTSILELKKRLTRITGIPHERIRLQGFDNERTLASYDIHDGSRIYMDDTE